MLPAEWVRHGLQRGQTASGVWARGPGFTNKLLSLHETCHPAHLCEVCGHQNEVCWPQSGGAGLQPALTNRGRGCDPLPRWGQEGPMGLLGSDVCSRRHGVVAWWSPSFFIPFLFVLPVKVAGHKKPFPRCTQCLVDTPVPLCHPPCGENIEFSAPLSRAGKLLSHCEVEDRLWKDILPSVFCLGSDLPTFIFPRKLNCGSSKDH